MSKYIAKILAKHLKQLSKAGLDAFIVALCGLKAPQGCNKLQKKDLKRKTATEVADIIIDSYTVRHGPKKVRDVLKKIKKNQMRIELQKDLKRDKNVKKCPKKSEAASRMSGGLVRQADQKQKVKVQKTSQQPGEQPKPKRRRKPKSETKATQKSAVKAETSGGAAGRKRATKEPREKPKRAKKSKTSASRMSGGLVRRADQKQKVKVQKISKPTVTVKPMGAHTGCNPGKSQQPGEQPKHKRRRKPKSETKATQKSEVNAETSGGATGGKRATKEPREEDEKPKRTKKSKTSDKKHLVTENRNKLINNITHVDPVLDDLLEKRLLTNEQYDIIRKKETSQEKMRELYGYVRSWGPRDNDTFLSILRDHNPVVIKNLKENTK
ncbi:uncharacterized protein [Dendrobates tinctorius]|uniref:uncharacterized protein n=1 Tax=Dendrobates tinctorius TaxID=92724 RepID=UPI003CC966B5